LAGPKLGGRQNKSKAIKAFGYTCFLLNFAGAFEEM
jgi:hypothetical protein